MEQPPQKGIASLQPHVHITRVAVKALADKNIPVVEYGQQIQWRHGDPVVLLILSDHGFPRVPPSTSVIDRYGQWERDCIIHKLRGRSPVYLYPLSFVGLELQDTLEVASTFDRTMKILTPKPRPYMVSLIRHLLDHPVGDSFRIRVEDDLVSFISFYILRDKPLNTKEGKCWDDENEEDFQKRVENAGREMKTWDWGVDGNENNYLHIAESVVRDCRSIDQLSNF